MEETDFADFDQVEFAIDFAAATYMMLDGMSYEDARAEAIAEYKEFNSKN